MSVNAAATLALGVNTGRARSELNELVGALNAFKGALVEFNQLKASDPLLGLSAHAQGEVTALKAQMQQMVRTHETAMKEVEEKLAASLKRQERLNEDSVRKLIAQKRQYEEYVQRGHSGDAAKAAAMAAAIGPTKAMYEKAMRERDMAAASIGPTRAMFEKAQRDIENHQAKMLELNQKGQRDQELSQLRSQAKMLELNQKGQRDIELSKRAHLEKMAELDARFQSATTTSQLRLARLAAAYTGQGLNAADRVGPIAASHGTAEGIAKLNQELEHARRNSGAARDATAGHAAAMRDAHSAARGLAGGFHAMWLTWGNIAPLLAGFAVATSIRQAVEGFAKVQYQMTFVSALADQATVRVDTLGHAMHNVALQLGISPEKASEGLRTLAQAGLSTGEAFASLPATFKLATVGELSVGEAALAATSAMNAFGLGAGQIERIGDVMAKAGAMSATSVSSMAQSMKYASTIAQQYGVSIEEVGLGLTAMAKRGITGTMAGTSFKNMLNELAAPQSQKAKDLIKQLGIEVFDATGKFKPLREQVEQFRKAMAQYDRPSQLRILRDIFGERGDRAFGSLLAQSADQLKEWQDKLENAGGFTAEVFMKLQQTTKGQFDLMLSQIQNTFAEVGDASSGPLIDMMQKIRGAFADESLRSAIRGLVQSVTDLLGLVVKYGPYVGAFWAAWGASSLVATGVRSLAGAVAGLGVAAGTLNAAGIARWVAMFNPYVRVISLVATLAGGLLLLRERQESLSDRASRQIQNINNSAEALEKENEQLAKKNDLLRSGVSANMLDAQLGLMEKQDALSELYQRRSTIEMSQSGRLAAAGNLGSPGARQAASELDKLNALIVEAEAAVAHLEKQVAKRRQLLNDAKVIDEAAAAAAKKALEKNQPTGAKVYAGNDRDLARQVNAEQAALVEQYRHAEKMARNSYDSSVRGAKEELNAKLITNDEYLQRRWEAEEAYRKATQAAELASREGIAGLKDKAASDSQRTALDNELKKIANRNAEQSDADRQRTQDDLQSRSIQWRKASVAALNEELPALQAKSRLDRDNLGLQAQRALMTDAEIAALDASVEVNNRYNASISKQQAILKEIESLADGDPVAAAKARAAIKALTDARDADAAAASANAVAINAYTHSFAYGAEQAFAEYVRAADNAASASRNLFQKAFAGIEDQLVKLVMTGKANFRSLAQSILEELVRIEIRAAMSKVIGSGSGSGGWLSTAISAIGALASGGGGAGSMSYGGSVQGNAAYVYDLHEGGIVGQGGSSHLLRDMSMFATAPRYHNGGVIGLKPNERPAVLEVGERVLPRGVSGGDQYNIEINVTEGKSTASGDGGAGGTQLARQIEAAVVQVIMKQKRPGGLLAA